MLEARKKYLVSKDVMAWPRSWGLNFEVPRVAMRFSDPLGGNHSRGRIRKC